ncbi:hypothetical protein P4910_05770 [Pantoea stewartii]|uniref:hypothetical protein n=1 Tax=Pantoea stewartii TaxID=66269 RepID=UPI0023F8FB78|nr:hypothetical protein [Pantoea stewartii]MDF7785016.1 hypothetical protein [Pantoea stewartii]
MQDSDERQTNNEKMSERQVIGTRQPVFPGVSNYYKKREISKIQKVLCKTAMSDKQTLTLL